MTASGRAAGPAGLRRWLVWGGRGAASLTDQALFAGTHFAINVMLARWLPLDDYGLFAVAYSITVFANALHTPIIAEPLAIFWANNLDRRDEFLREALSLNLLFVAISAAAAAIGGGAMVLLGVVPAVAIPLAVLLAVALPLFWFARQAAYADMKPAAAVGYTGIYAATFLVGSVALRKAGLLDSGTALAMMGLAAIAASLWAARHYWARPAAISAPGARRLFGQAWTYGLWAAPTGVLMWLANNIFFLVLPAATSLADSGRLKMVLNILMPFQQVLIGVSLIALPAFARLHAGGQAVRAARMTRVAMLGAGLGGALFGLVLLVVGPSVFTLIYGARHAQEAPLILYGLGLPMIWGLIAVARVDLRARQNVRLIFFGYAAGGLLAGISIVPLALPYATAGALIGMTAMFAAVAATLTWLMWKEKSS